MDKHNNTNKPNIRELTLQHGVSFPNDEELLMMILGSGTKSVPVQVLAKKLTDVIDISDRSELIGNLSRIKGMGESKALTIAAAIEFGYRKSSFKGGDIKCTYDLIPYVQNFSMKPKEHFVAVTLNGRHEIIQIHVTSVGTLNKTIVSPRDVFTSAITENASAVIVCHNHPSGNVEPSRQDVDTTSSLLEASKVLGIPILDHIIIDRRNYFSCGEHGLLFENVSSGAA